jgi:hypothetical protein
MTAVVSLLLILSLPLLGVAVGGRSLEPYAEFPPTTRFVVHEPFSWSAFVGLAGLIALSAVPMLVRVFFPGRAGFKTSRDSFRSGDGLCDSFPWWGWVGLGWIVCAWILAWNRFEWLRPLQALTFTPLWLGYIVVVNALTFRRTGRCMMLYRPFYFASLFPLSAGFWWLFEYLNRYVQNWFYVGGGSMGPWEYVMQATIPFATVLPAVLSTAELLSAYPRLSSGLGDFIKLDLVNQRSFSWALLLIGCGGLFGIGLWPNYLFPLVWVAPLSLITALQGIRGETTIFSGVRHGDWRVLWQAGLAALLCGFFWELWNVRSLAHWEYAIPFVHRFQLFEMPALGYAGYMPFGLECLAVADAFSASKFSGGIEYYRAGEAGTDFAQRNPTVADR